MNNLAKTLVDKGIDGFFVDNCDVYYHYKNENMLIGLSNIMKGLISTGRDVIINGGDCFLDAYCNDYGKWSDIITGINQECIFSSINWDEGTFETAHFEDRKYFTEYIENYHNQGARIFLLEYTTDNELINQIEDYCQKKDFSFYISDTLNLDID